MEKINPIKDSNKNHTIPMKMIQLTMICFKVQTFNEQALTSFQPRVTCSPPEIPDPEKSRVKTVIFEGSKIIAASLASALHPLP